MTAKKNIYAQTWDSYVEGWRPETDTQEWPGDEWGVPEYWDAWYEQLFMPAGAEHWNRAVEIGPGSGKYTLKLLTNSDAIIRGYDVSERYIQVCSERCREWAESGRLHLRLLEGVRADEMLRDLEEYGWSRHVDAFYSIDAMVHVDLQYLVAYFLTAALTLRAGGKLIMTLADATKEGGFAHLMDSISWTYAMQGAPSGKFEWVSPDIVSYILTRFGSRIDSYDGAHRDMLLTATLVEPEVADSLRRYLNPPELK